MNTIKLKVEGLQQSVDAFVNSIPQNSILETSGSLPRRNAERVHKYLVIDASYLLTEKSKV